MTDHFRSKKRTEAQSRLESIYSDIRARICLLDYTPGSRVPEGMLCKEFGLSRTPIRRVLTRLEAEGLIETLHGDGTYVTNVSPDLLNEVYQLRMELAPLFGRLSPQSPSPQTLAHLRDTRSQIAELIGHPNLRKFAQLNIEYYLTLTSLIGNRPLREITEKLFLQTSRIWLMQLPELDWDEVMKAVGKEISHVVTALESGDMEAVGLFSRLNIQHTMHRYLIPEKSKSC